MNQTVIDQIGRSIILPIRPERIVSLVPSQTELLFDLGLDGQIVGVTRFCIHPGSQASVKTRVGGTKDFNFDLINDLKPDLIIGNKEENYIEGIEELSKHFPVWMSDIATLDDACEMMMGIGEITDRKDKARNLVNEIRSSFYSFSTINDPTSIKSCAYFIWRKPYMVAASGTFIDHMLCTLGVKNIFAGQTRYPEVTAAQIADAAPDYIFLSSEPYSFSDKHIDEFKRMSPSSRVIIVDGELFSWYGSRLRYTPAYFEDLKRYMSNDI